MISYGQIIDNSFKELDSVAEKFENAFKQTSAQIEKTFENFSNIPMNVIKEEDGSRIYEIAAVGLAKEDIKVTIKSDKGSNFLCIKINTPEKSEEEKQAAASKYFYKKIKVLSGELPKIWLAPNLDVKATSLTLVNGLLTIRVPVKEEEKPVELTIE